MNTLVISKPGSISVVQGEKPGLDRGEVLIRVRFVGFCGSDLSTYLGKNPLVQYPRVPGHEISGLIEETGAGVPEDFVKGDRVTVVPYTSCGKCASCGRGRSHACRYNQTLGVQRDGAMREYLAVPWEKLLKAGSLNELQLAMVEPLTVGFHAVERGRVLASDRVLVLGCGMIGSGAIIGSAQRGATVIAADIDDQKLDLAKVLGASYTINTRSSDLHEELTKITDGNGPDVVVEAAGNPLTYLAAVEEVAFTGRVVCIGYAASEVAFATKLFVQKELDILGSRNASPDNFRAVTSYLEKGTFPLDRMITAKVKPAEASVAVGKWAAEPGKVMKILLDLS